MPCGLSQDLIEAVLACLEISYGASQQFQLYGRTNGSQVFFGATQQNNSIVYLSNCL